MEFAYTQDNMSQAGIQTGFALSSSLSPCAVPAWAGESGGDLTVSPPGIVWYVVKETHGGKRMN
jgi:hypothetical protein